MKKISKGALAMVFAGAVTFSVANALLAEQPLKRLAKEIALPISADREKADVIKQAEKTNLTPTTNVKDHDRAVTQVSLKNSNLAAAAVQLNTKNLSYKTTTNETPAPTPVATTVSVKSAKAPTKTTTPTKPRTDTTSTNKKPATTTKPV
ncbi:hypothetical protein V7139_22815, partial [Neobacillus drentensis]|uniref:hypothetical protein n=1 Tax=Neobacillus drentensis TaxID=220684 RepID=UPI0030015A74